MWVWAAFICYNTACLPPVAKIEPPPAAVECPKSFRAKNYAKAEGDPNLWNVVCAESGPWVYGGLSFYDGEGNTGEGGLLRLNRQTNEIEVRRPKMLRKVSINSIAADGDVVWFGTRIETECEGYPFVHGLVRYDWKTGESKTWTGSDDGPIGFLMNAIALRDSAVWVETELGLSKLDLTTNTWHHFDAQRRERTAKEIFDHLLKSVPRDCRATDNYDDVLIEGLQVFRPKLLQSILPRHGR